MRRHGHDSTDAAPRPQGDEWKALRTLFPYLWEFRGRVLLAAGCLILAKVANVGVPILMKEIVDALDRPPALLVVPAALLIAYGALRLSSTLFTELRDVVFARVTQHAIRRIALEVFRHLHGLSLRFHLARQTGGMSRDIERGTRAISALMSYLLFSILPTLVEIGLVAAVLLVKFPPVFALVTVVTLVIYIGLTVWVTEWRTRFRRAMNELDSKANTRAIDSLLNYETVKYFGNEAFEARRYDENLAQWEQAAIRSQTSLGALNAGQSLIIAAGVTALMTLAAKGVVRGELTLGDLVLVNALLIQLYIPLNFLGVIYRELKQSVTDMERMFRLLDENREVEDRVGAPALVPSGGAIRFENVSFGYERDRQILFDVSFEVPAGKTVAVVGASGAGKSTLSRLLFRFYDVWEGRIVIDGIDIRDVTQSSLRAAIGIVPQDTVLFNDTVYYNVAYGRAGATREEVVEAARAAHMHGFISSLPQGYDTLVGERGLKLSGGEKQRVAIARAILKNPPILVFDEATSALDSRSEKAIQAELDRIAAARTTLVIAHRLSTIVAADEILVLDHGRIVERGSHLELLGIGGTYAHLWELQRQERVARPDTEVPVEMPPGPVGAA
ncbi:MAG TPA: ABC transporter ATP-binding protein/permease [Pelomicrobium sp.]|nr:ABC transporter ATP-binding protein/permease [Pelomicrobium sp.]